MGSLNPNKTGVAVKCCECGLTKKPVGRDVPLEPGGWCHGYVCRGYYLEPHPGSLWPGESEEDYGKLVDDTGTNIERDKP